MVSVTFTDEELRLLSAVLLPLRIRLERQRLWWPRAHEAMAHIERVRAMRDLSDKIHDGLRPPVALPATLTEAAAVGPQGPPRVVHRR